MRDAERKKAPKGVPAFQRLEWQFPTAYVSGIRSRQHNGRKLGGLILWFMSWYFGVFCWARLRLLQDQSNLGENTSLTLTYVPTAEFQDKPKEYTWSRLTHGRPRRQLIYNSLSMVGIYCGSTQNMHNMLILLKDSLWFSVQLDLIISTIVSATATG